MISISYFFFDFLSGLGGLLNMSHYRDNLFCEKNTYEF